MRRLHNELGISYRNITISTVGVVPMIYRLAEEGIPVSLAVSLHAATDQARQDLMPIAKKPGHSIAKVCILYIYIYCVVNFLFLAFRGL